MKNAFMMILVFMYIFPLCSKAWVAEDIQVLLKGNEFLLETSNAKLFYEKDGYIVVSHGIADYKGDFEASRKIAQADAYAQISKLLGESEISAKTSINYKEESNIESKTILNIDEFDTSILMGATSTRAYWIEGGSFHIISCLYLNLKADAARGILNEEFFDINLDKAWVDILNENRDIWLGGANVVYNTKDKKRYLMVLVSIKDSLPEPHSSLVLNTMATREAGRYINGISFRQNLKYTKELKANSRDFEASEKLETLSVEKLNASIKALVKVGELKHKISKRKYALYLKVISDI